MKFKPLHDRVLIEVLDGSEKTAGGIIIPDTAQEKPGRQSHGVVCGWNQILGVGLG